MLEITIYSIFDLEKLDDVKKYL